MKNSLASKPNAAMARVAGPPHGVMPLMILTDMMEIVASTNGFMPRRIYSASIAEMVIMCVVVPSPSNDAIMAMTAVPIAIFTGSPFTSFMTLLIKGSNSPASIKMPKNKIANSNKAADGATCFKPSIIIVPSPDQNPPMTAKTIGTTTNADTGDIFFAMIKYVNTRTIETPNSVRIVIPPLNVFAYITAESPIPWQISDMN